MGKLKPGRSWRDSPVAGLPWTFGHVQDAQPRAERVGDHRALSNRDFERPAQDVTATLLQGSHGRDHIVNQVVHLDLVGNVWMAVQDDLGVGVGQPQTDRCLISPRWA